MDEVDGSPVAGNQGTQSSIFKFRFYLIRTSLVKTILVKQSNGFRAVSKNVLQKTCVKKSVAGCRHQAGTTTASQPSSSVSI